MCPNLREFTHNAQDLRKKNPQCQSQKSGPIKKGGKTTKSKETYRQTRGLSNIEMKHVGELAIIGVFLKAVKTSCVRTTQGRTYLTKRRLLLHSYYRIVRVAKLQLNREW